MANAQASICKMQGKPDLALQTIVTALNRKGGDVTLIRTYLQGALDNSKDDQAAKESSVVIQQDQQKIFWWHGAAAARPKPHWEINPAPPAT